MFIYYNPNPDKKTVGDCVIRALTLAFPDHNSWENIYADLTMLGHFEHDMPNSNSVWGLYLTMNGYVREIIPDTCPDCYTINDFANEHPYGTYILATGSHVVGVVNGNYYDTSDSGREVPIYYFRKEH